MADIIQLRGGTAAAWVLANPVLANKELGVETDTKKMKLGNGVSTWAELDYISLYSKKVVVIDVLDYGLGLVAGTVLADYAAWLVWRAANLTAVSQLIEITNNTDEDGRGWYWINSDGGIYWISDTVYPGLESPAYEVGSQGEEICIINNSISFPADLIAGVGNSPSMAYVKFSPNDTLYSRGDTITVIGDTASDPIMVDAAQGGRQSTERQDMFECNLGYGVRIYNSQAYTWTRTEELGSWTLTSPDLFLHTKKDYSGWGNDIEPNKAGVLQRYSLSEAQFDGQSLGLKEVFYDQCGFGQTIDDDGDAAWVAGLVSDVGRVLNTTTNTVWYWNNTTYVDSHLPTENWTALVCSSDGYDIHIIDNPANPRSTKSNWLPLVNLTAPASPLLAKATVKAARNLATTLPVLDLLEVSLHNTGKDLKLAVTCDNFTSGGDSAHHVTALTSNKFMLLARDGGSFIRDSYEGDTENWVCISGAGAVVGNTASYVADGWGNTAKKSSNGFFERYSLSELEHHHTERVYELDVNSTGLGITYTTIATIDGEPVVNSEWRRITDTNQYYYGANDVWNSYNPGGDTTRDLGLLPYIAGSNNENSLLLKKFNGSTSAGYVVLPGPENLTDRDKFLDGDRYRVKCGDAVDSDNLWLTVVTSNWRETNGIDELPSDDFGREVIPGLGISISGFPNIGFKVSEWEHWEFIALPSRGYSWSPASGQGVLFSGDGRGDGWGNSAKLNKAGYLSRYTLSEEQYLTGIERNIWIDAITTSPANPYIAGSQGENKINIYDSTDSDTKAFIVLPGSTIDGATGAEASVGDYLSVEDWILIDSSDYHPLGKAGGCIVSARNWTRTDFQIQDGGDTGMRDLSVEYPGLAYTRAMVLSPGCHVRYDAYVESGGIRWANAGHFGVLFNRTDDGDGWGNPMQLNRDNLLKRYTLGEDEYIEHKRFILNTNDHAPMLPTLSGSYATLAELITDPPNTNSLNEVTADGANNGFYWFSNPTEMPVNADPNIGQFQPIFYGLTAPTKGPYVAGSNGEGVIICTGSVLAIIELPTAAITINAMWDVGNRLVADYKLAIDTSLVKDSSNIYCILKCDAFSRVSSRTLPLGLGSGHLLDNMYHSTYEFYPEGEGSTIESYPYTNPGKWAPCAGEVLVIQDAYDRADGWGNNPDLDSRGNLKRFTVTQAQRALLDSGVAPVYHNHQAGIEGEPVITDNLNGTFGVAAGECWFYTDATRDTVTLHDIEVTSVLTPTDDVTGYICADRSNDTWTIINAISTIDYLQYIPYFKVIKRTGSNSMHFQKITHEAHGDMEREHEREMLCGEYQRAMGAMESISVDTSLNITASGGIVYAIRRKYTIPAITAATRQFKCINTGAAWTITSNTTPVINNLQYNGPTGAVTLTDTFWTINYLYRGIEDQDHCYTVLGTAEFATKELAQASNYIASLPELISSHTMLIGRVIVQKSATTSIVCESSFSTIFAASTAISDHGSQGGLGDDDHTQYFNQTRGDARYVQSNTAVTPGTGIKITYDAKGLVTSTTGLSAGDLPVMTASVGGAVPTPPNNTTTFLRGDGTFAIPPTPAVMTATVGGLVPTPPNNTTTFLRGDGTFATASSVIGTDKQIPFNDAGTMAGDADLIFDKTSNHLEVGLGSGQGAICLAANTNDEVAEPGELVIYAKSIAGRVMPKWVGPSGVDTYYQAGLAANKFMMTSAVGTAYNYLACGTRTDTNGSSTHTAMTTGSIKNQLPMVVHASGTTAGTVQYSRHAAGDMSCYLGNAANMGGFFFVMRFGIQALGSGNIAFFGLSPRITPTATANLNTYVNIAGVGYQANSGNWFLVQNNGSGTGTLTDLGATMPLNTTNAMELVLYATPNSTAINYRFTNLTTGVLVTGVINTDPPAVNTLLTPMTWVSNNASTTSCQIWVNKYSIETDY